MKSLLRTWTLLGLAALPLFMATISCSKKTDDPTPPAVAMGTVDGTITPVGSINQVVLTLPGATTGPATIPDVQGYFKFSNVEAGTYNVSFREASGYIAPSPSSITVAAGGTASVGSITVNPSGPSSSALRGTATWSRGGTAYTSTTIGGTFTLLNGNPSSFNLLATSQSGSNAEILGLALPYFGGANLYLLEKNTANGFATYVRTAGGIPQGTFGTSGYNGTLGTITVTTFNATARTMTGTFGFTAFDSRGSVALGTDRVDITNGTFSLSY